MLGYDSGMGTEGVARAGHNFFLCVEGMASSRAGHDEAKVSKVGESRTWHHYVVTGSEVAAGAWLELGTVKLDRASENNNGVE